MKLTQAKKYYLIMVVFFILSRIVISLYGVKFDKTPLTTFCQCIDFYLLKNNLTESLFYLHSQPPLFNLFLGIGIKLFPNQFSLFFHLTYMFMSLIIYFILFFILKSYGLKPFLSFILASIFIISPEAILYENWLFYTWPVAFLITVSAFFIRKYTITSNSRYALFFSLTITAIALTRSSFHIIIIFFSILILHKIPGQNIKRITLYSSIPVIFILGLYTKNFILFDTFGPSSWLGMNIFRIASRSAQQVSMEELYKKKAISELSLIGPFRTIDNYPDIYHTVPKKYSHIRVLSEPYKKNGNMNLNYYGYIGISKKMKKDSIIIIKNNFFNYIKMIIFSWGIYSKPSWDYSFLNNNYYKIKGYVDFITFENVRRNFEQYLLKKYSLKKYFKKYSNLTLSSLLLIPFSMIFIFVYFLSNIHQEIKDKKVDYTLLYMIFIIFILAIIGNALEIGENNRFRVMTDPLLYMLVIIYIFKFIQKRNVTSPS